MMYSAVGLAVLGGAAGLGLRWKVLLPIIVALPFVIFLIPGLALQRAAITLVAAEAILQAAYFAGLLVRSMAAAMVRSGWTAGFRRRIDHKPHNSDGRAAPR
jgi:uncharacterized membrane protein YjjB (DUF3815 family)